MSADYHSSNGYDYILLINNKMKLQLFPIDEILAHTFIPIPKSLYNKYLTVKHIDGNTHNNSLENLEWIENNNYKLLSYPDICKNTYLISSMGIIKNKNTNHVYKPYYTNDGHLYISLKNNNGLWKNFGVHQLVCFQFNSNYSKDKKCVNHIDGDPSNNHFKNLEWVSYAENNKHAYLTELRKPSRLNANEDTIIKICKLIAKNMTNIEIYNKLTKEGCIIKDQKMISRIRCKVICKGISDQYF